MYNPYNQKLQNKLQKLWGKFITRSYEKKMCNPYNQKLQGKLQNYKYMTGSYIYDS